MFIIDAIRKTIKAIKEYPRWREICVVALMGVAVACIWLARGKGWDGKEFFGWDVLVHADIYYQTAVIITTMYILLVAFRAERFVRRTSHEEELSLELAQNITAVMDSIRMELASEKMDEPLKKQVLDMMGLIDTRQSYLRFADWNKSAFNMIWKHVNDSLQKSLNMVKSEKEKISKKIDSGDGIDASEKEFWDAYPGLELKFEYLISLCDEIKFAVLARAILAELDESDHGEKKKLRDLYTELKTVFIHFRKLLRNNAIRESSQKGNDAVNRYEDSNAGKRLAKVQEIESDMDKFIRSKLQGTDNWEWVMLGILGSSAIIFTLLFFPNLVLSEHKVDDSFYTVKIPAILISGVIAYLFVKLWKLEWDRRDPIMGMTYTEEKFSKKGPGGLWQAYFGVIFPGIDNYAQKRYEEGYSEDSDIPAYGKLKVPPEMFEQLSAALPNALKKDTEILMKDPLNLQFLLKLRDLYQGKTELIGRDVLGQIENAIKQRKNRGEREDTLALIQWNDAMMRGDSGDIDDIDEKLIPVLARKNPKFWEDCDPQFLDSLCGFCLTKSTSDKKYSVLEKIEATLDKYIKDGDLQYLASLHAFWSEASQSATKDSVLEKTTKAFDKYTEELDKCIKDGDFKYLASLHAFWSEASQSATRDSVLEKAEEALGKKIKDGVKDGDLVGLLSEWAPKPKSATKDFIWKKAGEEMERRKQES